MRQSFGDSQTSIENLC